jgi:MoaA/NifB/PqqE/SkfB family radical SAM enzyme
MNRFLRLTRPVRSPVGIVVHPYAPPIGGQAFSRYLQGLRRMARGEYVPLVAHISVTDECGNSCSRCSNLGGNCPAPGKASITGLIGQLRTAGTVCVAFTGGEPALRADLPDLIAACGDDIAVTLFTSGQGCNAARARVLRNAGLKLAFVSLDHHRADVHDSVRGTGGSFRQAVDAIKAFREANVYTAAQAVAGPELLRGDELDRYIRFCAQIGANEVMLLEPVPVRGNCHVLREEDRQRLAGLHLLAARSPRLPKVNAMSLLESARCLGCQAGFSFLYVRANGDVFPCDFAPVVAGNAFTEGIPAVLEQLARYFPRPTVTCLAFDMLHAGLTPSTVPVSLAEAGVFLRNRDTKQMPDGMSWLPPKKYGDPAVG